MLDANQKQREQRVKQIIDDTMNVREQMTPDKFETLREALAEGGKTIYQKGDLKIEALWCPTPENPRLNAWLLRFTAPAGSALYFGDLIAGNLCKIIPFRIPMDGLWISSARMERGEWFEPLFEIPDEKTVVKFDIKINDIPIKLEFSGN